MTMINAQFWLCRADSVITVTIQMLLIGYN